VSFNEGIKDACNLLEYCNGDVTTKWGGKRAENGHPMPYNVKYWQVGNECWGEKYDRACVDFCTALKKIGPKIILLAADDTPLLLECTGQYLDYVSHHYYYMKDADACQSSIKEQQKVVEDANLDHEIKMAITEWNITAADFGLNRGKMLTLSCALDTAEFLNVMHNCSDFVGLACRSNMTNSCCSGYIITNGSGVLKTPSYLVMKLYADHYKPVPVEVNAQIKDVDFSACRSDDGKRLTIFAVNSTDAPVEIQLDLNAYPGLTPTGGEVVCDTLDKRQPELMNHWTAPDRVKTVDFNVKGNTLVLPAMSVVAIECVNR
jgi:alpha-N-arabinofuranosidase